VLPFLSNSSQTLPFLLLSVLVPGRVIFIHLGESPFEKADTPQDCTDLPLVASQRYSDERNLDFDDVAKLKDLWSGLLKPDSR
jgi:hypothetical protein